MSNPPLIFGIGGLVAGIFVGVAIGGSMVSDRIDASVTRAMERSQATAGDPSAAAEELVAALGERIGALESSISEGAASSAEISESVRAQLGEMQEALSARIDAVGESAGEGTAALRAALEDLGSSAAPSDAPESAQTDGAEAEAVETEVAAVAEDTVETGEAAEAASTDGEGDAGTQFGIGQTAVLADGAVRAFVSRIDAEAGSARIAVNGLSAQPVAQGESLEVSSQDRTCTVTLTAVNNGSVGLDGNCD